MHYLVNPIFPFKILKSYISDIDRLWNMNSQAVQAYQERKLLKMIKYAYQTVSLYRKKYDIANINPDEITTINHFNKIPFLSKEELINAGSQNILPSTLSKKGALKTSTSGTTGKPVSIYVTLYDIITGLFGYIRALREHGINWKKDKIALILDLRSESAERRYLNEGIFPVLKPILSFDNIRVYNISSDPEKLIKDLDNFQPDFIGGYIGIVSHLAVLKQRGLGNNVNPRIISLTGAPLDVYMRKFIAESFNTRIFESFGATESGHIAFECHRNRYHINADLVYAEFVKDGNVISTNEPSRLVITKLYGEGTPIIRYTGINDIVTLSSDLCSCGLGGRLIEKIYGRENLALVFPGGRFMMPSAITEIFSRVLYEFKTRMLKQTQIIQRSIDDIKIRIVIDHKISEGISSKQIISVIQDGFNEKIGSDSNVKVDIKEVKKIEGDEFILSTINKDEFKSRTYL